jgi:hypothetical protein
LHPPHKSDPSSIVVADVQNESDALHILALASAARPSSSDLEGTATRAPENGRATPTRRTATMDDFALVRLGIVDEEQIVTLVHSFFQYNHHMVVGITAIVSAI